MLGVPIRCLIVIFCSLLLTITQPAAANDAEHKRAEIKQLDREMQSLKKLLNRFRSQRSSLQNNLRKAEVDIGAVQQKIRIIQQQLKQQQRELQSLQHKRRELTSAQQKQQKIIAQQVLAAYQIGQQKKLKVLLNQQQPEKLSRSLTYYDYFNRARSEQIEAYINIINELDVIEPQITSKAASLKSAKATLDQEYKSLQSSQRDRKKNLYSINSAIKTKDQHLKKINNERAELERLLEAVEQTIANISIPNDYRPFAQLKGKLHWPIKGKPSNRFGSPRDSSKLKWQGVIIPARAGTTIKAIHHGRVVFADWLRGSGLLVIVDHGDGYMSLYAHNQSLLIETGDWVTAGDNIATVGNSGGQLNSGLYFEIRHKGKPTNPIRWCKR